MACNSCGKTKTHDSVKITSEIKSGQKVNNYFEQFKRLRK